MKQEKTISKILALILGVSMIFSSNSLALGESEYKENVIGEEIKENEYDRLELDEGEETIEEYAAESVYTTVSPTSFGSMVNALLLDENATYYREYSSVYHSRKWYSKFTIEENSYAYIGFTARYHYKFSILDENGNEIYNFGSKKEYSGYFPLEAGTYYILLNNEGYSKNSIVFSYYMNRNVNCEIEPNDTFSKATNITLDTMYLAFTGSSYNEDYFAFNTKNCVNLRIYIGDFENIQPSVWLYENDRVTYTYLNSRLKYEAEKDMYYYDFTPKYEGEYYIRMHSGKEEKSYTFMVCRTGIPDAVTDLKATSYGKNKVLLTWNYSENADGYLIYGQKRGSYDYVGMTTKGSSFVDKTALDTEYNFYWVFPYVKNSFGKMVPGGCKKYVYAKGVIPAVTNIKASSVKGGVKLTWKKQEEAEGYLIYGIRENGIYGYVGIKYGVNTTSYIDNKASRIDYNFYWIYPFHYNENGKMIIGGTSKYTYGRAL